MVEAARRLLDRAGVEATDLSTFPDELKLPCFNVPGVDALSVWLALRELVDESGFWPVVLGDAMRTELPRRPVDEILNAAGRISVSDWLKARAEELDLAVQEREDDKSAWPVEPLAHSEALRIAWGLDRSALPAFKMKPRDKCLFLLAPTRDCTEVPAYLQTGGYNECPPAEYHVAMLRYWRAAFDIEVAAVGAEELEIRVANPPRSAEAARKLAIEQFLFCPDNVWQDSDTLRGLAVSVWCAPVWRFWWD